MRIRNRLVVVLLIAMTSIAAACSSATTEPARTPADTTPVGNAATTVSAPSNHLTPTTYPTPVANSPGSVSQSQ